MTFREAARQYHKENAAGWKSAIYARQWLASLESHAIPKLGDVPTGGITAADIIDVLMPIWQEIPETARQVRNRICVVLDYAHAKGWQYARLVDEWVTAVGLRGEDYGTHSLRRTKASIIYKATGNLRAVPILLGHTKIENTVRYLGVDVEDALTLAEGIEV